MRTIEIGKVFKHYSKKTKTDILKNICKTNNVKKSTDDNVDIFIVDGEFVKFKLVEPW